MVEPVIHIEASRSPGRGPIPPSFAELVERFCLDMAAIRSRLANVGRGSEGVPRDGPIRGPGAPWTGPWARGPGEAVPE